MSDTFLFLLYYIIQELLGGLYIFLNFYFLSRFFSYKEKLYSHRYAIMAGLYFCMVLISILRQLKPFTPVFWISTFTILCLVIQYLVYNFAFEGPFFKKLILFALCKGGELAASAVTFYTFRPLFPVDYDVKHALPYLSLDFVVRPTFSEWIVLFRMHLRVLIMLSIFNLLLLAVTKLCLKHVGKIPLMFFLFLIPVSQAMLSLLLAYSQDGKVFRMSMGDPVTIWAAVAMSLGLIGDMFIVFAIKRLYQATDLEKRVLVGEMLQRHYDLLDKQQQQIREMQHDIDGHITVIRSLMESGENSASIEYLDKLTERRPMLKLNYCGNSVINAFMVDTEATCKQHGIRTDFKMIVSSEPVIDELDLITILSNLMSNAIEASASEDAETRFVLLHADEFKDCLTIHCENSCTHKETAPAFRLPLGKLSHGNGQKIVRRTAEKYDGEVKFEQTEEKYAVTVFLYKEAMTESR